MILVPQPVGIPPAILAVAQRSFAVFFASPFWRKLQNIFGGCCSSKMEEVAATHYGHGRGAGHPQGHHVRSLYYQPKFPSRKLFSVSSPQRQDEGIPALSR